MNLIDDFSILVWGEKASSFVLKGAEKLFKKIEQKNIDTNTFSELSSIILCVNPHNESKFLTLKSFLEAMSFFDENLKDETNEIKMLQIAILNIMKLKNKNLIINIYKNLDTLEEEKIINDELKNKITSLLDLLDDISVNEIKELKTDEKKDISAFEEHKNLFKNILKNFQNICENKNTQADVDILLKKLDDQSFSIGVTGIMNAGKSTMLNALLKKEILGTSVIPETANLTLIKYGKTPFAKVNFWNISEWNKIEQSASFLPSMEDFVKQTKEKFANNLHEFIRKETLSKEINCDELSFYTSAENSGLKCNLVKSVELHEEVDFLKKGVNIVDTPGLDDPVVQREEITKKYLNECDVLIHLMNVNQSATEKDVDFIIDSLTYGHISRLLIVLTKIDTINEDELKEVIAYTKTSIKARLQRDNKEAQFNTIISKIDFLPIAGKLALMHRIGEEEKALKLGYDLQKTGILAIEKYIKEVLFGSENEKNKIFLQSVKKEILLLLKNLKETFSFEKESLGKSQQELKEDFHELQTKNNNEKEQIENLKEQITIAKSSLQNYFITLEKLLKTRLLTLKSITIQRVVDDVSYEWRKNKKKPKDERIKSIIETSMKDGLVDILRDYRYEFQKKMQKEIENIDFKGFNLFENEVERFDTKEFLKQNFNVSFISYALVNQRVLLALKEVHKGNIDFFSSQLDEIFKSAILEIFDYISPSLLKVNQKFINNFVNLVNKPLNQLLNKHLQEEEIIKSHIQNLQSDSEKVKERAMLLKNKIAFLVESESRLKGLEI